MARTAVRAGHPRRPRAAGRATAAALALLALLCVPGCGEGDVYEGELLVQGDPDSGRGIIARLDCGACHVIPGVPNARGRVGPSLAGFARQGYIAGQLPNRPAVLVEWLGNAPGLIPGTVMPAFALTEREARDIAAYLYSLK